MRTPRRQAAVVHRFQSSDTRVRGGGGEAGVEASAHPPVLSREGRCRAVGACDRHPSVSVEPVLCQAPGQLSVCWPVLTVAVRRALSQLSVVRRRVQA